MQPLTRSVIVRVKKLMLERGTLKIKLGEVLGIRATATSQAKAERAHRFLSGKQKSVSLDELKALADFFEKPLQYFLQTDAALAQTKKAYSTKGQKDLDEYLMNEGLNLDERKLLKQQIALFKNRKNK